MPWINDRSHGPRPASFLLLLGVLGGSISSAVFGRLDASRAVAGLFMVSGTALFTWCAWRSKVGWEQLIRLRPFRIAAGLALVGLVINRLAG